MARELRIQFPGGIYHVRTRGNSKQDVFLCDSDRWAFMRLLEMVIDRHGWLCHGYCLMTNHYHLIIETPRGNLSPGMKVLNGAYTQSVNRRHGRTGHIYEGRFRSKVIEREDHLLEVCRYIALNPVKAGLVSNPMEWRWSSYRTTCEGKPAPQFLTTGFVLSCFSDNGGDGRQSFSEFVLEGLALGDFRNGLPDYLCFDGDPGPTGGRPPLQQLINPGSEKHERQDQVAAAVLVHKYTLREVSEHLGVARSTISRAIKKPRDPQSQPE